MLHKESHNGMLTVKTISGLHQAESECHRSDGHLAASLRSAAQKLKEHQLWSSTLVGTCPSPALQPALTLPRLQRDLQEDKRLTSSGEGRTGIEGLNMLSVIDGSQSMRLCSFPGCKEQNLDPIEGGNGVLSFKLLPHICVLENNKYFTS